MNFKTQRGTAIIEYVIILAFICGIGASFTSDGLTKPINSIISKAAAILDLDFDNGGDNLLAKSEGTAKRTFIGGELSDGGGSYTKIAIYESQNEDGSCNLIPLKPDTTYEIVVDIDKMKTGFELELGKEADLGIFIWDQSTTGKAPIGDTRDLTMSQSKEYDYYEQKMFGSGSYVGSSVSAILSDDGKTMTYSFTTKGEQSYLGMALQYSSITDRDKKMAAVAQNYQNFLTLREAK